MRVYLIASFLELDKELLYADPGKLANYEMEVTKDPNDRTRPLFFITFDDNELVMACDYYYFRNKSSQCLLFLTSALIFL